MRSTLTGNAESSTTSAWTAAITTTVSSASRWADNARPDQKGQAVLLWEWRRCAGRPDSLQSEHATRDDRLPSNKPSVQQQYHGPADQCELGLPAAGAAVLSEGRSFQ